MTKDFFLKNRTVIIGVIIVLVIALVAGVGLTGKKTSGSTKTVVTLSSLSARDDGQDTTLSNLNTADTTLQDNIDAVNKRVDTSDEDYKDVSDNVDTLLKQVAAVQTWQTAHDANTSTPTPTPNASATATPTATPAPTPTPTLINRAPVINTFVVDPPVLEASEWYTKVDCTAHDPDGNALTYTWAAGNGSINGVGPSVWWVKVGSGVTGSIGVIVSDGNLSASYTATIVCN